MFSYTTKVLLDYKGSPILRSLIWKHKPKEVGWSEVSKYQNICMLAITCPKHVSSILKLSHLDSSSTNSTHVYWPGCTVLTYRILIRLWLTHPSLPAKSSAGINTGLLLSSCTISMRIVLLPESLSAITTNRAPASWAVIALVTNEQSLQHQHCMPKLQVTEYRENCVW